MASVSPSAWGRQPVPIERRLTPAEALEEMEALLRAAASPGGPTRIASVRYTECRTSLLESELRAAVPGFLVQCGSASKFHEFINLLDPRVEARIAFLERAFQPCRDLLEMRRHTDVFDARR